MTVTVLSSANSKLTLSKNDQINVIARPTHVSPPPRLYNINRVTYKGGYMSRTQSKYDWPHHIAQQKSSGLSVKEYSAQHGFSPLSFYVNRKKLMKPALPPKKETAQAMPSFLNLGTLRQRNSVLISFPDGTRVEINGEQSTEHLCSILKTLRTKGGTRC